MSDGRRDGVKEGEGGERGEREGGEEERERKGEGYLLCIHYLELALSSAYPCFFLDVAGFLSCLVLTETYCALYVANIGIQRFRNVLIIRSITLWIADT